MGKTGCFQLIALILIGFLAFQVFHMAVSFAVADVFVAPRVELVGPFPSSFEQGDTVMWKSSAETTGTPPYFYQWFSQAPDAVSYSAIDNATLPSYNFTTGFSTQTGIWNFILQVTDSAADSVNSTAVSVKINPGLAAPSISANLWTIIQGETSILSAVATTGMGYYVFSWFAKSPDGSYVKVDTFGSVSYAEYAFETDSETPVGNWSFYLQVTDQHGETAFSSAVEVTVNSPPPTPSPVPSPLPGQLIDNVWFGKASMPIGRSGLGVAAVEGSIYAIGGSTYQYTMAPPAPYAPVETHGSGGVVGVNEQYNFSMNSWVERAQMPTPREDFAIAVYNDTIYCIGGLTDNSTVAINEAYYPANDSWVIKAPMPMSEANIQADVVGGKIYILGGSSNYVYDVSSDSWASMSSTPNKSGFTTSSVVDGRIYVIGSGMTEIYDPSNKSWSAGAPYPEILDGNATSVSTSGEDSPKQVYVFNEVFSQSWSLGLHTESLVATTTVQAYNLANNSWSPGADLPSNRYSFGVAVLNDSFFVIGGCNTILLTSASWVPGSLHVVATNEQYLPFGYGRPDPSYFTQVASPTFPPPAITSQTSAAYIFFVFIASVAVLLSTVLFVYIKRKGHLSLKRNLVQE